MNKPTIIILIFSLLALKSFAQPKKEIIDIEGHLLANHVTDIKAKIDELEINVSIVFYNVNEILGYKLKNNRDDLNEYINLWKEKNPEGVLIFFSNNPVTDQKKYWEKNFQLISTIDNIDVSKISPSVVKQLTETSLTYEEVTNKQYSDNIQYILKKVKDRGFLEELFGDLEVNEETAIVAKGEDYKNPGGSFKKQNSPTGTGSNCECKCSSRKYAGENKPVPELTNYLFNKVVYKPATEVVSLKAGSNEFDIEVLSENTSGYHNTLTGTKEIITFETLRLKAAIEKLSTRLDDDIPTMIGVSYGAKKGPYNAPANTTDHYMLIVAKGRDNNGFYFRFLDPALTDGDQDLLKLHINPENLLISGECQGYRPGDSYYLVELLLDEVLSVCSVNPEVDPLIGTMKTKYGVNPNYYFNEETQSFEN